LWQSISDSGLPVHFHTIGAKKPALEGLPHLQQRQAWAVYITGFQLNMANIMMEIIYGGVLETYSDIRVVIGESGIGWIPYILDHMDLEWEDQFKDLTLTMKPSDYWRRQFKATYQSDKIGLRLLDVLGEETVMWGSDFPHPDGVWPDSQTFIENELGDLPEKTRNKIVCGNAADLYGFSLS
jgi:predicted TIM-barrel fold metal-dependent hydrolase